MSSAQNTKDGLLIPAEWLKNMGDEINVQRTGSVVIIESKQRLAARKRLGKIVRSLRLAAREAGALQEDEIAVLVDEVRRARAGYR